MILTVNLLSSTGTVSNPWRYDDGYYDTTTGLYKFGERYYSPIEMRWTQLDPSGQDPGYVFASDDPANEEDLSGTFNIDIALPLIGAGLGCIAGAVIIGSFADIPGAAVGCATGAYYGTLGGQHVANTIDNYTSFKSFLSSRF
jgi:RHS repeat-associated protein